MKKNLKLFIMLLIFLFLVCFHLCLAQQTQTQTPEEPINASGKNFPIVGCVGIIISIPQEAITPSPIVVVAADLWPTYPPPLSAKLEPPVQQEIIKNILSELEKAGYSIPKSSSIFGTDESQKPRFLIGGALVQWVYYYHRGFWVSSDGTAEASVKVQWEVYDKISKKVIYQATTDGYSSVKIMAKEKPTFEAIKISFRKFLSNPNLISAIQNCIANSASVDKIKLNVVYYTTNKDLENIADKIKEAMKSSFIIKLEKAYGTGFIINPEGYALTNYHVVKDISTFDAVFSDGKIIRGEVIKTFSDKDLAIIKLSGSGYPYLPLRFASDLKIGEDIFAIGTPASLELFQIVSKGIISAINNDFKLNEGKILSVIQTDASINAGNSGGPLVDSKGFAVGINSYGIKPSSEGSKGLNYAISIDEAIKELGLTEAQPQK